MSWQQLDTLCRKLESLDHAQSILRADEATNMPSGGGEKRAEAVSMLAAMHHEAATAPEIADLIAAAKEEVDTPEQDAALREFARLYANMTCLPADLVRRQTETGMRTEQLWRDRRSAGDWNGFAPALADVIALMREEAALRSEALGLAPYDALMEQYDPGHRTAEIDPLFADLKAFLRDFLPQALDAQEGRLSTLAHKPLDGPFPIENQRALGLAAMQALGFDFTHGRLDESHHPFCGGVPTDVRMTTRYRTDDFLFSLMAVLHETGHAQYEQGLPREHAHWPSAKARGMAMHESQSLFNEMQIAHSAEFWDWALPVVHEHIGPALDGWSPSDVLALANTVARSLIRVEADEVTYPLHIILRYELEQQLVAGTMEVDDIPEAWDAKIKAYLGLSTLHDPANGPMQDVHWSFGAFGYFPSYTLGAMIAAQQWAAMEQAVPTARDDMAKGDFTAINAWRRDHIWQKASTASTGDILIAATGEPLNADYFKDHLKRRYAA